MFKLHRHKADRSGERLEFKFSQFQALQVPKGWDKLFVSIISVESGKTIAKSGKAVVRGGTCQWTETLSESMWVSQDDASKELEECLFKIVVAMGSTRSSILGEAVVNLTYYISSRDSIPLSLPLKKCNYGTIVQVRIQCLPPRTKSRDGKAWMKSTTNLEDMNINNDDVDNKSDGSDMSKRSIGSFSGNYLAGTYPDEPGNREASFSASGSHRSSDSGEIYVGKTNFSPKNSSTGGPYKLMGRQDSTGSHNSATSGVSPGDDASRSNHSSFSSRVSGSSFSPNQWQDMSVTTSAHGQASLSLNASDSSKDLLEAADETIEELRDEAKMWERHARKLKLDVEILKKESSDKSKHQTNLDVELSSAYAERDSLRQELEQLKSLLKESKTKQTITNVAKIEDIKHMQNELEDEVKLQKECNANLALQLKKTQEANIELVSILQELEAMIEKQREEIGNLSQKNKATEPVWYTSQKLLDIEAEWAHKMSVKEEEIIKLEEKLSAALNMQHPNEIASIDGHPGLVKEIEVLKAKVQELEKDCAELTDENLDLILKMKELRKEVGEGRGSHGSRDNEVQCHTSSDSSESLALHIKALEEKCTDLELDLQYYKAEACNLDIKLHNSQAEVENKIQQLNELQQKLESSQDFDMRSIHTGNIRTRKTESWSSIEMPRLLFEINKQLLLALDHVKDLYDDGYSDVNNRCSINVDSIDVYTDEVTQKEQAEAMVNKFLELNDILSAKASEHKSMFKAEMNSGTGGTCQKLVGHISEIEELKSAISMKEEEIDALKDSKRNLENLISTLRKEKGQLEENLKTAHRESSITSRCLDDVRNDLMVLTSGMESSISANKILQKKSVELESSKSELELHIAELEQENIQLSERISGLEAQLRYLTNEKESNRLELEYSRSLIMDLKNEISKQQSEMETQKVELKQKRQEAQKSLSEVLEESEVLRRSHSKLQATVENLIEECTSLQKLNGNLKKQKLELHERSTCLEVEMNESQRKNLDFCKKVELLEVKLSSLQRDIMSKESSLISQLETIFQEHKKQDVKISQAHNMLNKVDLEKTVELENLHKELAQLTAQMSSSHDERERITSDAVREASSMRMDNAKLESSLQEAHAKIKMYETELSNLRQESRNKVQGLVDLLNASKQSEEMLMNDIDHMQRVMEGIKSSEEKFKKLANELELRLRASDYEKQQITEEISSLKLQLQKISELQDKLLALQSSLDNAKFEKEKLEELLKSVSEECEELKTEKVSYVEKISNMQKALHDAEDDQRSRIALEEKLLRLEGDLTAREASYAHEAELKNEIKRIKRTNSEYQRKIQYLEEEKDELMKKAEVLEKELMVTKEHCQDLKISSESGIETYTSEVWDDNLKEMQSEGNLKENNMLCNHKESRQVGKETDLRSKLHVIETELVEALEANKMYKVQLQRSLSEKQNSHIEVMNESVSENDTRNDEVRRILQLEEELKDMRERYLQMSLQYAEVEAQREEMVMKLKHMKKEKQWFS